MKDLPLLLATLERARSWLRRVRESGTLDDRDRSTLLATIHMLDPEANPRLRAALADGDGDADGALREGRIR